MNLVKNVKAVPKLAVRFANLKLNTKKKMYC